MERQVSYIRKSFFYRRDFASDADLNAQALRWLDTVANVRIHGTLKERPADRFEAERPQVGPRRQGLLDGPVVPRLPELEPQQAEEAGFPPLVEVERRPLTDYARYSGDCIVRSPSRRERIAAQLADLKMPGALEPLDEVLAGFDGGKTTAAGSIEHLLAAPDRATQQPASRGGHALEPPAVREGRWRTSTSASSPRSSVSRRPEWTPDKTKPARGPGNGSRGDFWRFSASSAKAEAVAVARQSG